MALVIPNAPYYVNDLKPFVPDFKFLGDVLQKRQDMYNTNYKAINKAYSNVVYGNLSRDDTNEARNNFLTKIGPELEKVSGLDLSLQQNAMAAQGIFKPFYEEDIIVKDLVVTKAARDQAMLAQRYLKSTDPNIKRKYWDIGMKDLQMQMNAFKNASRDEALQMSNPVYTENPDLYKKVKDYLEGPEMQGRYKVSLPKFSSDRKWIITDTFGNDVTKAAMNDVMNIFRGDPTIQQGYRVMNRVQSYENGQRLFESGQAASIQDGINLYNRNLLSEIRQDDALNKSVLQEQLDELLQIKEKHDQILKTHDYKPGTRDYNVYQGILANVEALENSIQQVQNDLNYVDDMLSTNDPDVINRSVGNSFANNQILKDVTAAVTNYRDTNRVQEFKKNEFEYQRIANQNAHNLALYKAQLEDMNNQRQFDREQKAKEQEDRSELAFNRLLTNTLGLNVTTQGLTSDGELAESPEDVDPIVTTQTQFNDDIDRVEQKFKTLFTALGVTVPEGTYEKAGSLADLRDILEKEMKKLQDEPTLSNIDPTVLMNAYADINKDIASINGMMQKYNSVLKNNVEQDLKLRPDVGGQTIPKIVNAAGIMTPEQYVQKYLQAVENGEVYIENKTPDNMVLKSDAEIQELLDMGQPKFIERTDSKKGETYLVVNPAFYKEFDGQKYKETITTAGKEFLVPSADNVLTEEFKREQRRKSNFEQRVPSGIKGPISMFSVGLTQFFTEPGYTSVSPFVNVEAAKKAAKAEYELQRDLLSRSLKGEGQYKSDGVKYELFGYEAQKAGDMSAEANIGLMSGLPDLYVNFTGIKSPSDSRFIDLESAISVLQNPNAEAVKESVTGNYDIVQATQQPELVRALLNQIAKIKVDKKYTDFSMTIRPNRQMQGTIYNYYEFDVSRLSKIEGISVPTETGIIKFRVPKDLDQNIRFQQTLDGYNGLMSSRNTYTTADPTGEFGTVKIDKVTNGFGNISYTVTPTTYQFVNGNFVPLELTPKQNVSQKDIDAVVNSVMFGLSESYKSNRARYGQFSRKKINY